MQVWRGLSDGGKEAMRGWGIKLTCRWMLQVEQEPSASAHSSARHFCSAELGNKMACELVTEHQCNTDDDKTRKSTVLHLSFAGLTRTQIWWNNSFLQGEWKLFDDEDCLLKPLRWMNRLSTKWYHIAWFASHILLVTVPFPLYHWHSDMLRKKSSYDSICDFLSHCYPLWTDLAHKILMLRFNSALHLNLLNN